MCIWSTYTSLRESVSDLHLCHKNKEVELADQPHKIAGMLLYAKTNKEITPNREGNKIAVWTLDLNQDFSKIKRQLDCIVTDYLEFEMVAM